MTIDYCCEDTLLVKNSAEGQILVCKEALSFWGGVDPATGLIIDSHHPNKGEIISDRIVLMPTSRGSCSGSGVLLQLALNRRAPSALVFCEGEEILTLGAIIASRLFNSPVTILRLSPRTYNLLSNAKFAEIKNDRLYFLDRVIRLSLPNTKNLKLTADDSQILNGRHGKAKKIALEVICQVTILQGGQELTDVSRAHIDGCILSHDANLLFAEKMYNMGAKVCIPTTTNAISVARENWKNYQFDHDFGVKAARLADAYVNMGAFPSFTCAPYLLEEIPVRNEKIGWSESNAVIYANSVIGARTQKHPDYLDLFIALTGRAPNTGVYLDENRVPVCEIQVNLPLSFDDSFWPMLGLLAGLKSPYGIPILTGLEGIEPNGDNLKALCAAFGTTSAAPMVHLHGHTPESKLKLPNSLKRIVVTLKDFKKLWEHYNVAENRIDLVAIGSPHASLFECQQFADFIDGKKCIAGTRTIITVGRNTFNEIRADGTFKKLKEAGVQVFPDICWCSIREPIFPQDAKVLMTNSGKYAHYGKGLSGRDVRFGSLENCAQASISGHTLAEFPEWLL